MRGGPGRAARKLTRNWKYDRTRWSTDGPARWRLAKNICRRQAAGGERRRRFQGAVPTRLVLQRSPQKAPDLVPDIAAGALWKPDGWSSCRPPATGGNAWS